jgi:hypothetical protein
MTPRPIIDLHAARELLRQAVPTWEEFLGELEAAGGRLKFRPELCSAVTNLKIDTYPLLYERPEAVGLLLMQAVMDPAEIAAFNFEAENASPSERGRTVAEIAEQLDCLDSLFDFPDSAEDQARAVTAFEALDQESKQAAVKFVQYAMMGALVMFYEYLSVAVHGEKLSSLVAKAKSGDDQAYGKAVQIDGRILAVIPYFRDRYARASTEDHEDFLAMVSRKRAAPPYKGRITHKSLLMTFAFLEGCGLLSTLTGEGLLDLCDDVGVGASGQRMEDVKNLQKRLTEYRRFQKRGGVSTP